MSLNDQISSLRSLASEVKKQSGSSVRQHAANGLLDILRLRKQFVDLIYQAEAEKETTAKARGCLEAADSELQNLLYEKRYYELEIALCRGFASQFPDSSVDLQSVEEFWEQADEDLKAQARGNSDAMDEEEGGLALTAAEVDRKQPNVLMLARLEYEMRLRKKLSSELEATRKKKLLLQQRVQEKERAYKSILSTMQEIEAAAVPLQPYTDPAALQLQKGE